MPLLCDFWWTMKAGFMYRFGEQLDLLMKSKILAQS
jgi:hypothetical protein